MLTLPIQLLKDLLLDNPTKMFTGLPWSEEFGVCIWCGVDQAYPESTSVHKKDCPYQAAIDFLKSEGHTEV